MSDHSTPHVLPKSTYYAVYAALLVLLVATVGFAFVDMGSLNFPVTMAIAVAKAADDRLDLHARVLQRDAWSGSSPVPRSSGWRS